MHTTRQSRATAIAQTVGSAEFTQLLRLQHLKMAGLLCWYGVTADPKNSVAEMEFGLRDHPALALPTRGPLPAVGQCGIPSIFIYSIRIQYGPEFFSGQIKRETGSDVCRLSG
jgi:hypothetical protein